MIKKLIKKEFYLQRRLNFKAVSLFETLISLTLIIIAFVILSQTFFWVKGNQFDEIKKRIQIRNERVLGM